MAKTQISLTLNGMPVEALVEPRTLLIHFLREQVGLTGAHIGCETTHCGACTVDMDGKSVKSCTVSSSKASLLGDAPATSSSLAANSAVRLAPQEVARSRAASSSAFPSFLRPARRWVTP